jgi:O-antigen/teichoic acid export membrane protein
VLVPVFSEMEASDSGDGMRRLMIAGGRASLYLSLPFLVALLLIGDQFITLWIGPSYADKAYLILVILLIPQFFEIPQQVSSSLLFGIGKHKFLSYANTISGLANLALSIVLALKYGVVGVAIGTAVPQLVLNALVIPWYVCRQTGTGLLTYYLKVYANCAVSAAVFAVILYQLSTRFPAGSYLTLALNIAVACLGYLAAVYCTGLRAEEKGFINSAIISLGKKVGIAAV